MQERIRMRKELLTTNGGKEGHIFLINTKKEKTLCDEQTRTTNPNPAKL